jgi:transcriptional regulator with XRE-family HTH domain
MEERSKAQQRERFRQYLRARLAQTGVTKRELSLAMGKDRSYITQLLDEEQTRSRALPDPDDLRRAAPLLGVPLVELLEQAYGITRHELERELGELARHNEAWATGYAELTMAQQEQVRTFIAYV